MAKRKNVPVFEQVVEQGMVINERSISNFLSNDYKEYAKYVIQNRAIPSVVDGFKVGARKIMHAAFTGSAKGGKTVKFLNLVGDTLNRSLYKHGNSSLEGTILTLGSFFSDNLAPMTIVGQGGTLRDPNSAAAPRYLSVKLNENAELYQVDEPIFEYQYDEGQWIEPKYYLPLIPTVLTSNTSGIAVGYGFSCFSYNPIEIIEACIASLTGTDLPPVTPYVKGMSKESWKFFNDRWESHGKIEIGDKGRVEVYDLPYDVSFEKFESMLDWLVEQNQILDWTNSSKDDKLHYTVHYDKNDLARRVEKGWPDHPYHQLNMYSRIEKDNLTVLSPDAEVIKFNTVYELINYFVKFRLAKYHERKTLLISKLLEKIAKNEDLIAFIKAVVEGRLIINNRPMADIKADLDNMKISYTGLGLRISKVTKEEYEEMQQENIDLYKELEYVRSTTAETMYLNELEELRTKLAPEFSN